jgi:peptidoglycan/LPS O-acetylase OafA/YrhL
LWARGVVFLDTPPPTSMIPATAAPARPALASLTGLRFVAAIAVVLYHLPTKPGASAVASRLMGFGYLGVSLFFVLSGFILTYTYVDPDGATLRASRRDFWWARVARVYPAYALALLFSLPIFLVFRVMLVAPASRPPVLLSATLTPLLLQAWWPSTATQWNTPGWSLSVEVFFYAVFPFGAVWLARRRNATRAAVLVWMACLAVPAAYLAFATRVGVDASGSGDYFWVQAIKFNPMAHLGELAVGAGAGLLFLRRRAATCVSTRAFAWSVTAALIAVAVIAAKTSWLPYLLCHNGLLAPVWAALVLALASGRGPAVRMLGSRPMVRLGEASYALYLFHSPLLGYHQLLRGFLRLRAPGLTTPAWLQASAFLVTAIALSLLVFRRVEEPARRAIRRWRADAGVRRPEHLLPHQGDVVRA